MSKAGKTAPTLSGLAAIWIAAAAGMATPALTSAARADVLAQDAQGFTAGASLLSPLPPARLWARLATIGAWWDPQHSFSGEARNLSLSLRLGGCFCETLRDGGFVRHMEVVMVEPGSSVVMRGALGPLMTQGVIGAWRIAIASEGKGSRLTWRYAVGGHFQGGPEKWAGPVDHVLSTQMANLAETAAPKAK